MRDNYVVGMRLRPWSKRMMMDILSHVEYFEQMCKVNAVKVLTTRDHTMQRGALEAMYCGQPRYLVIRLWPSDLRDCVRAIIVLLRLREVDQSTEHMLHKVIEWTVNHMH